MDEAQIRIGKKKTQYGADWVEFLKMSEIENYYSMPTDTDHPEFNSTEPKSTYATFHMFTKVVEELGFGGVLFKSHEVPGGTNLILFDDKYVETHEEPVIL